MSMAEKGKDTIDISILYQVASDRLNLRKDYYRFERVFRK